MATKPARVADERVQLERHSACNHAAVDDDDLPAPTALRPLAADVVAELGYPAADALTYRYFLSTNGHIYRSRDRTASARMYSAGPRRKKKVWHGGYFFPFVCDYVGAPIAFHFFEARVNEATAYADSYEQLQRMLGHDPVSVTVDKGLLTRPVFEHNTRRGVATIGPDQSPPPGARSPTLRPTTTTASARAASTAAGPRVSSATAPAARAWASASPAPATRASTTAASTRTPRTASASRASPARASGGCCCRSRAAPRPRDGAAPDLLRAPPPRHPVRPRRRGDRHRARWARAARRAAAADPAAGRLRRDPF